jgi:predicted nucleotidyltransferase
MKNRNPPIPANQIEAFCHKWKLNELSVFGSALRDDFGSTSDVDILISFSPGGKMTFEGFIEMREELSALFGGRPIDLVEKRLLRNPFRRHEILTTREVLYAACPN